MDVQLASAACLRGRGLLVATGKIPNGGYLDLIRHGDDYEILFEDEQLMGSWQSASEAALATLVCDRLGSGARRILIGGLGMGFTLAAARLSLSADATIVVSELVPAVVEWARGPLAHIFGGSLEDPRVSVDMRDVHDVIVAESKGFDAILLDVDNGPDGLISHGNERLYCNWGLGSARAALRPGGILAIWSAYPDNGFAHRLASAGFQVEEVGVDADGDRHVIWLGTKPEGHPPP